MGCGLCLFCCIIYQRYYIYAGIEVNKLDIPNIQGMDNLSEEEKQYAIKILKELSEKGKSDSYDKLLYADYKEVPVDIETFLDDD